LEIDNSMQFFRFKCTEKLFPYIIIIPIFQYVLAIYYKMNYFKNHPFATGGFLAIPLIVFVVLMDSFTPQKASTGFDSFIIAFEFAQSESDVNTLFINLPPETINNIDTGIYLDFGFMITYSFSLALFFTKSVRIFNMKWLLAGIPLSVIIFFGDFFENLLLLKITQIYYTGLNKIALVSILEKLHIITWVKWGGLALAFMLMSIVLFKGNWLSKLAALACLLPLLFSIAALNNSPAVISIFTQTIFASFAILVFYSFLFRNNSKLF